MTGLEPHPIFPVPTRDEIETMIREIGEPKAIERLAKFAQERGEKIALELKDPYRYGYRPPIWHVADELLQEGKEIILVDPDWDLDDPDLRRRRPPDFLHEAAARKQAGLGPITMMGKRELWVAGSNRSGKTEYAAAFIANVTATVSHARTWSWSDSEEKSQAKQQPIVWKYIPDAWKQMLNDKGKLKNMNMKIGWGPDGFVGNKFVAPNGSRHWFNNYKQLIQDIEGDQLDASWHDEERDPERIKTVRVRLGDRNGTLLVTFTSIDASFTAVVNEYEAGSVTKLEVEADWLPTQKKDGVTPYEKEEGMTYQKVRRVATAGPGSDGDQQANILHFHISDNPYYGYNPLSVYRASDPWPIYGARKFYLTQNIAYATTTKIRQRAYGLLVRGASQQFKFNSAVHLIDPRRIPEDGTRFLVVDPCPGRNWFMGWILVDRDNRWFVYREWPSYGGEWKTAYVPGIGDPEPWALPGAAKSGKTVYDGIPGPAQQPFRFGLRRYKEEIERVEDTVIRLPAAPTGWREEVAWRNMLREKYPQLKNEELVGGAEIRTTEYITERYMDARGAAAPREGRDEATTLIEEMSECGMDFRAAPAEQKILSGNEDGSIAMINELLDYDPETPIGAYSANLSRLNEPRLFISSECPNIAFALAQWTGKDGQQGACKDPVDILRYAVLAGLSHVGEGAYTWQ